MYNVRRVGDGQWMGQEQEATDERAAARLSGLATPGAQIIVTCHRHLWRLAVDTLGRIRELSRYEA